MATGRNRRTFGAVSKWEGAGVQQRRKAGRGQGSGSEGYKPPPLSPGCCSSAQPAHTCHAHTHPQHTSQDSAGAGRGANPQPPLLPEAPAHSATSRRLLRPTEGLPGPQSPLGRRAGLPSLQGPPCIHYPEGPGAAPRSLCGRGCTGPRPGLLSSPQALPGAGAASCPSAHCSQATGPPDHPAPAAEAGSRGGEGGQTC